MEVYKTRAHEMSWSFDVTNAKLAKIWQKSSGRQRLGTEKTQFMCKMKPKY